MGDAVANRTADIDWRGIRDLVASHTDPRATDRELLRQFAEKRDESAFVGLFRRHCAMVLATGRRVLGNTHDAEDVCQAAFLVLARKAASQRWQPSIAQWLHKTAHQMALRVRRSAERRMRREQRIASRSPG